MPLHRYNVRARRIKLFTRTKQSPSSNTFINNENNTTNNDINDNTISSINSDLSSSIVKSGNMLHSKSTYFYHGGISSKFNYIVPSVCGLAFLVGLNLAINPTINKVEQVNATDNVVAYGATDGNPTISLETGGAANGTATNVEVGETAYRENTITVSGHDISGYTLYINTAAGESGELVGTKNPFITIGKVAAGTKGGDLPVNTWGYAITNISVPSEDIHNYDLLYNPVPSGESIERSIKLASRYGLDKEYEGDASFSDVYGLTFAARLGENIPSDHYKANVYISAIGDAYLTTATGISEDGQTIYAMQEMTINFCNAIIEDATSISLYDKRDGKVYFVSRLRDGNCWMTQNLDFDIAGSLSAKDTNVIADINDPKTIKVLTPKEWLSTDNTANYFYDPGDYIYAGIGGKFMDVDNCTNIQDGFTNSNCADYFTRITASNVTELDLHYHVGNYYSWPAVTAQADKPAEDTKNNATESICPKGWELPMSNTTNNANSGSFYYLLNRYGLSSNITGTDGINIYGQPLYFVYGGRLWDATFSHAGNTGYYWSSTQDGAKSAYEFDFYPYSSAGVYPSRGANRSNGYTVRCIFKTS